MSGIDEVETRQSGPGRRGTKRWLFAAGLALLAGAGFWLRARLAESEPGPAPAAAPPPAVAAAPREVKVEPARAAPRPESAPAAPRLAAEPEPIDDGKTPMQPHPADPARAALIPPWAAFEEVESALARRDFEAARRQLELRRQQDPNPEEWRDFYEGLDLLRECQEAPGEASRARGQRFIAEFRASPLRRHVRRACLAGASG